MNQDVFSDQHTTEQAEETARAMTSRPSVSSSSFSFDESSGRTSAPNVLSGKLGLAIGLGLGLLLGVGVVPKLMGSSPSPTANATAEDTTLSVPTQPVSVASAQTTQIQRTLGATGTVVAADLLPILSKAPGLQIQQVLVDEGDRVSTGQTLAILDQSVITAQITEAEARLQASKAVVVQREAALAQAQARLAEAEANLERYTDLSQQGAVSQQELDTRATTATTAQEDVRVAEANISSAAADVRSQEAQIEQLQTQLGQAVVTAPANGIVAERFARIGDVTSGSQALFTVIRDRLLELDVDIPETQLPLIEIGSPVAISSDADSQLRLQGRVQAIAPLVDPQTRQAIVTISLPDSLKLRPGMFLQAGLTTETVQGLTIPAAAILPQSDESALVYRVGDNNQVQAQTVAIGEFLDGNLDTTESSSRIEILQGLQVGDRVVVKGVSYLNDGDSIEIVDNE